MIQSHDKIKVKGCKILRLARDDEPTQFPGAWFCVVVDADEYMVSFLSEDYTEVYEAFWSKSPFLTLLMYNGLFHEFTNRQTWLMMRDKAPLEDIRKFHKELGKTYLLIRPALEKFYTRHGLKIPVEPVTRYAEKSKPPRKKPKS